MNRNAKEYVLLSVPLEMLEEAGIEEESILQISTRKGKIILDTVRDATDYVCDGDCEGCPCRDECGEEY